MKWEDRAIALRRAVAEPFDTLSAHFKPPWPTRRLAPPKELKPH
jgi:hypothetical protein